MVIEYPCTKAYEREVLNDMENKILLLSVIMFFGFSVLSGATPIEFKNRHVILDYTAITLRQPPAHVGKAASVGVLNLKNALGFSMSEPRNTSAPAPVPEPSTLFLLGCGIIWSVGFSKKYRQRKE
jgi:hypothetical protein